MSILPIIAILILLFVQMWNGYALVETKLYTPVFTYWLITILVVLGWLVIAAMALWVKWKGKA